MNEFRASILVNIGQSLAKYTKIVERGETREDSALCWDILERSLMRISDLLRKVDCPVAANAARRLSQDTNLKPPVNELQIKADVLKDTIFDSLDEHLFLWVPVNRALWFKKTPLEIVGADALERFLDNGIEYEIEEAAKSYGAERFTACGLHLMRSCEPSVHLFAKAIGRRQPLTNWGGLFKDWETLKADRGNTLWIHHKEILWTLFNQLTAIKSAYRDRLAHGEIRCDESEILRLLANVPPFIRQVVDHIDDQGKFV